MVMDMFYAYVEMKRKKRVHFHGFMLDVHESKLNDLKEGVLKWTNTTKYFPSSFKILNLSVF